MPCPYSFILSIKTHHVKLQTHENRIRFHNKEDVIFDTGYSPACSLPTFLYAFKYEDIAMKFAAPKACSPLPWVLALAMAPAWLPSLASANSRCSMLPHLMSSFVQQHIEHTQITPELQSRTYLRFIQNLDPTKTEFLESDVSKLQKLLEPAFEQMKKGDCAVLKKTHDFAAERSLATAAAAKKILSASYRLDEKAELVLESSKRGYPKTEKERIRLLEKTIHFHVSTSQLVGLSLEDAKKSVSRRYEVNAKKLTTKTEQELLDSFLTAFAQALDPHTNFLTKAEYEEFQSGVQLSLVGIGASLSSQDGYAVIEDLVVGGQAMLTGKLRVKDKIIAVAEEGKPPVSLMDLDIKQVVSLVRGKKDTTITLTVLRQGEATERFDVKVKRDTVDLKQQAAKVEYVTRATNGKSVKVGVISLPSFYGGNAKGGRSTSEDVRAILLEAQKEKVDAIVLNLTLNGGGLLDEGVKTAGLFIRKGGVVATQNRKGVVDVAQDNDDSVAYTGPLLILTSRFSASAAEILAGALKDYRRAIVIGNDHTYGKGSVQSVSTLSYFGAMKVTTGYYFLPNGQSAQHSGVISDITLPIVVDGSHLGEKHLPNSLQPKKIAPFASDTASGGEGAQAWRPVTPETVQALAARSAVRVSGSKSFAALRSKVNQAVKNRGLVRLADLRGQAQGGKKNASGPNGVTPIETDLKLYIEEGVNVAADLVTLASSK